MRIDKIPAKLKVFEEDFVVEEIGEKWRCAVSSEFLAGKPDLSKLEENDNREFLLCEMEKKGIDHFRAVRELASEIGKGHDAIGYAGSKDKKAWTSQRISIFNPDLELLKNFYHPNIYLKNFKWGKRKIKLGYLDGNHFRVVLRDLDKKIAVKIANEIRKQNGFPNYFGSQRFGSVRGNNVNIGLKILKRDFEGAVMEILTGVGGKEQEEVISARLRLRKEGDFSAALEYFPRYLRFERGLIEYLVRNPGDFVGSLIRGQRKSILMYVNSVQSKIFNEILEEALEERVDFSVKGQRCIPLFGYKMKFSQGKLGEIEQDVLKRFGLGFEDFNIEEIKYLRLKGGYRPALVEVSDLDVVLEGDEVYSGSSKMNVEFSLPSGVYATTFLGNYFDLEEVKD